MKMRQTRWTRSPRLCARLRPAFTLVELLVVIAIIGVLVGLLLPAVQAAREAARRVSCSNNLVQLGLAAHNFEMSFEHLPSGVLNPDGPIRNEEIGQHVSWTVQLLPYMEQQMMYDHFDIEAGAYAEENLEVRRSQLRSLECPSAWTGYDEQDEIADSSYAGCHHEVEAPIDEDNHGLLFLNSRVRYREIYDGSSNTILFGELLPSERDLGWTSGTRATLRNTGEVVTSFRRSSVTGDGADRDEAERDAGAEVGSLQVGGFGSFHPGGGNFNFADGSVRFLAERIDPELYRQLGHRSDGELMSTDDR